MTWYGPDGAPCGREEARYLREREEERKRDPVGFELREHKAHLQEVQHKLSVLHTTETRLKLQIAELEKRQEEQGNE